MGKENQPVKGDVVEKAARERLETAGLRLKISVILCMLYNTHMLKT